MDFSLFHFENNLWFLGLIAIPVMVLLYALFYQTNSSNKNIELFADKHLVPHLLRKSNSKKISIIKSLILGSIIWILLVVAMAGPRWNYKEFKNYKEDKTLLILLDLSKSMDFDDAKPSRLIRARQEIEDLIKQNKDAKIGLVAFAEDAHIVSPITEDMKAIEHLLPLLDTNLMFIQGTKLASALKLAKKMLSDSQGKNNSLLIISDGDFQDNKSDNISIIKDLTKNNVTIHTMGIGTKQGVTLVNEYNQPIERKGKNVVSKLDQNILQSISSAGKGLYFDAEHVDNAKNILRLVEQNELLSDESDVSLQWEERFYVLLLPVIFIILLWFKRGFRFPIIVILLIASANQAQANDSLDKIFLNKDQYAALALDKGDADTAIKNFDDPYNKGVAYYKDGQYKKAEEYFKKNKKSELAESTKLNLANSLTKQNQLKEALKNYQEILANNPNNKKAAHNLKIVNRLLEIGEEQRKKKKKQTTPDDNGEKKDPTSSSMNSNDDNDEESESDNDKNDDSKSDHNDNNNNDQDSKKDQDNNKDTRDSNSEDSQPEENKDSNSDHNDNNKQSANNTKNSNNDNNKENQDGDGNPSKQKGDNNQDKNNNGDQKNNNPEGEQSESEIDQKLDLILNDHKNFLKNQFMIESYKNKTKPTNDPW